MQIEISSNYKALLGNFSTAELNLLKTGRRASSPLLSDDTELTLAGILLTFLIIAIGELELFCRTCLPWILTGFMYNEVWFCIEPNTILGGGVFTGEIGAFGLSGGVFT